MSDIYENKEAEKNKINEGNGNNIEKHLPLLEKVVEEFENSGESREDLKRVGYIGLINAINLFQNRKEITFENYARNLIAGEIRHYIREKHKKVKIPGWLEIINKYIDKVMIAYKKKYNNTFDLSETGAERLLKELERLQNIPFKQTQINFAELKLCGEIEGNISCIYNIIATNADLFIKDEILNSLSFSDFIEDQGHR